MGHLNNLYFSFIDAEPEKLFYNLTDFGRTQNNTFSFQNLEEFFEIITSWMFYYRDRDRSRLLPSTAYNFGPC